MTLPHAGLVWPLWSVSVSTLGLCTQLWVYSPLCPVILALVSQMLPTLTEILKLSSLDSLSRSLLLAAPMVGSGIRHTWHTYTLELPNLIQASGIILTWVGDAFIDINLTAGPRVAL